MLNFIHNLIAKVSKSNALSVFFFIFSMMQLIGVTFIVLKAGYPVIAGANILMSLLLILYWVDGRTR